MKTTDLTNLPPATLAALAKLASKAAAANRDSLEEGKYDVEAVVTLVLEASVKVGADEKDVPTPQKARPWAIIHVLLSLVNKYKAAAGEAGLELAQLVEMAEKINDKLAKEAQDKADAEVAALKEPTRSDRRGKVNIKGTVGLPDPTGSSEAA